MTVEDHTVSFSLEVNVQKAYENVRQLQTILYRTFALWRRAGLPEDVDEAISKIQQIISLLNQMRLTAIAAYTATGPIGWALALVGAAGTVATTVEMMEDELRGR